MRLAKHFAVYLIARLFLCAIQAVRIETCARVAEFLGWLLYDRVKLRRRIIDGNLSHAFPEKSESERQDIGRRMYSHLVMMICEIAHAPRKLHEHMWREQITINEKRALVSFLLDRRPVVLVSAHFGNFEVAGFMLGLLGVPTFTVARPLDNPFLDRFLNQFRQSKGQFIIGKNGSALEIDQILERGGKLVLLGDQHAGPKGCWVQFFNRPASCHKAIAVFPLTAHAPLAVVYGRRSEGKGPLHFELGMQGSIDPAVPGTQLGGVKPITQWYNDRLEEMISQSPDQYWWLHNRWRDPPQKKAAETRAAA